MEVCFPKKNEFLKLAKRANLIPVYREILADLETPVSCFIKMGDNPYSYLLESVEGGEKIARFSVIGGAPSLIFKSKGRQITLTRPGKKEEIFITNKNKEAAPIPDSLFIFTDTLFIFDHLDKKIKVVSNVVLDDFKNPEEAYE